METTLIMIAAAAWLHALVYVYHIAWQARSNEWAYTRLVAQLDQANATILERDVTYGAHAREYKAQIATLQDLLARQDAATHTFTLARDPDGEDEGEENQP